MSRARARAGGGGRGSAAGAGPGRRPAHYARPGGWRWKVRAPRPLPAAPGIPPLSPPPGTHLRRGGAGPCLASGSWGVGDGVCGELCPPVGPAAVGPHRPRPRGARPPSASARPLASAAPAPGPGGSWGPPAAGAARSACGSRRLQSGNFPAGPEVPPLPAGAADLRRLPPKWPRSARPAPSPPRRRWSSGAAVPRCRPNPRSALRP